MRWLRPGTHETSRMRPAWWKRRQLDLRQPGWHYCACQAVRVRGGGFVLDGMSIGNVRHGSQKCGANGIGTIGTLTSPWQGYAVGTSVQYVEG